jgi:hypothetical protein
MRVKDSKGSMNHLDILLVVLKTLALNSPWKLGGKLEGFVLPETDKNPVPLMILEYILCSLGEETVGTLGLGLRREPFRQKDSRLDEENGQRSQYYSTDFETAESIENQRNILQLGIKVVDILQFPEKSILVIEDMLPKFQEFYKLHNVIYNPPGPRSRDPTDKSRLVPKLLMKLEPQWEWFEANDNVLFRATLLLARSTCRKSRRC